MSERVGKRAGLYVRISDDREGRELGVTRQEEDLREAAARAGDEVIGVYSDNDRGASTRSRKPRPEYERLLEDARSGHIEKIWAYTSSRLTRRPMEHEGQIQLAERNGIVFDYIRSPSFDLNTANGRMIARMLAAKDANEAEETGERIARKFDQKRASGEYMGGGRYFGWQADGATPEPAEHEALAQAAQDVIAGVTGHAIMQRWNDAGLVTSRGNRWNLTTWRQVMVRPRNAGLVVHEGEIIGRYPWYDSAPVTEDVWEAVCTILGDPGRKTSPGNKPKWLGSGLFVCWGCEQPHMYVHWSGAAQHRMYLCKKTSPLLPGRRHMARQVKGVDEFVEDVIVARLTRPDAVDLARSTQRPEVDVAGLRVERMTLRERLLELDDDLDAGRIDRERWLRRNAQAQDRLRQIDELLRPVPGSPFVGVVDADDPAAVWYGSLPDRSDGLPLEHRRRILDALMTVRILPVVNKKGFDPSKIEIIPKL